MGKFTKTIYVCDFCKAESEEKIDTCEHCDKDFCPKCSGVIVITGGSIIADKQEDFINYNFMGCKDCASKELERLKSKKPAEIAGEFIVKA